MTQLTQDEKWLLKMSADRRGFMPNALNTARLAVKLQRRGWLGRTGDVWYITTEGRKVLEASE